MASNLLHNQGPHTLEINAQLANLESAYFFQSDASLIAATLAEVPSLYPLLQEALPPLRRVFGEKRVLQLQALESDDDTVLRVLVTLPPDTPGAAESLRKFKQDWWLKNCSRSEASLVFDYQLENGI